MNNLKQRENVSFGERLEGDSVTWDDILGNESTIQQKVRYVERKNEALFCKVVPKRIIASLTGIDDK